MSFKAGISRTSLLNEIIEVSSGAEESSDGFTSAHYGCPSKPTGTTYVEPENVKRKLMTVEGKRRLGNKLASQRLRIRKQTRLDKLSTELTTEEIKNDKYKINVKRLEQAVKELLYILARELQGREMLENGVRRIKMEPNLERSDTLKFALGGLQEKNIDILDQEMLEEGGVKRIKIEKEEGSDFKFVAGDLREKRMLEGGLERITEIDLEESGALEFAVGGLQEQKLDILMGEMLEEGEVKRIKTETDVKESWALQSVARSIQENNNTEENWSLDEMINIRSESEESSDGFMSELNGFLPISEQIKPNYVIRSKLTTAEAIQKRRLCNKKASRRWRIRNKTRLAKLKREKTIEVIKNVNYKSIVKQLEQAVQEVSYMLGRSFQEREMLEEGGVKRIKSEANLEDREALILAAGGLREKDVDISYKEILEEQEENRIKTETDLEESGALSFEPKSSQGQKLDILYREMLEENRIKTEADFKESGNFQFVARGTQVNNNPEENTSLEEMIIIGSESEESSDDIMSAHRVFISTGITYANPKNVIKRKITAAEAKRIKRLCNNQASQRWRIRNKIRLAKLKKEKTMEVYKNYNYKSIIKRLEQAVQEVSHMLGRSIQEREMLEEGGVKRIKSEANLEDREALKLTAGGLREKDVGILYKEILEEQEENRIKTETDLEENGALPFEPRGLQGQKLDILFREMLEEKRRKTETNLEESGNLQSVARSMQENTSLDEVINISSESEESSHGFISSHVVFPSI